MTQKLVFIYNYRKYSCLYLLQINALNKTMAILFHATVLTSAVSDFMAGAIAEGANFLLSFWFWAYSWKNDSCNFSNHFPEQIMKLKNREIDFPKILDGLKYGIEPGQVLTVVSCIEKSAQFYLLTSVKKNCKFGRLICLYRRSGAGFSY